MRFEEIFFGLFYFAIFYFAKLKVDSLLRIVYIMCIKCINTHIGIAKDVQIEVRYCEIRRDTMIRIDYQVKRPIYEQVIERLQNLIVRGVLVPDTKLPSVRNLAIELSINPNTIQRAYTELERTGFIYTVKGKGNYVAEDQIWRGTEKKNVMNDLEKSVQQVIALGVSEEETKKFIEEAYRKGREA